MSHEIRERGGLVRTDRSAEKSRLGASKGCNRPDASPKRYLSVMDRGLSLVIKSRDETRGRPYPALLISQTKGPF